MNAFRNFDFQDNKGKKKKKIKINYPLLFNQTMEKVKHNQPLNILIKKETIKNVLNSSLTIFVCAYDWFFWVLV